MNLPEDYQNKMQKMLGGDVQPDEVISPRGGRLTPLPPAWITP